MNCDIVKFSAHNAFINYRNNHKAFNQAMRNFYEEAAQNPSVAAMILKDEIITGTKLLDKEITDCMLKAKKYNSLDWSDYAEYFWNKYNATNNNLLAITDAGKILDILKNDISGWFDSNTKAAKLAFDNSFNTLYPKTGYIRKLLLSYSEEALALIRKYSANK